MSNHFDSHRFQLVGLCGLHWRTTSRETLGSPLPLMSQRYFQSNMKLARVPIWTSAQPWRRIIAIIDKMYTWSKFRQPLEQWWFCNKQFGDGNRVYTEWFFYFKWKIDGNEWLGEACVYGLQQHIYTSPSPTSSRSVGRSSFNHDTQLIIQFTLSSCDCNALYNAQKCTNCCSLEKVNIYIYTIYSTYITHSVHEKGQD